jgi:hypothetical protein
MSKFGWEPGGTGAPNAPRRIGAVAEEEWTRWQEHQF